MEARIVGNVTGDTVVLTRRGAILISAVRAGDRLVTNHNRLATVVQAHQTPRGGRAIYQVLLHSGGMLKLALDTQVWATDGTGLKFMAAQDLTPNHFLALPNLSPSEEWAIQSKQVIVDTIAQIILDDPTGLEDLLTWDPQSVELLMHNLRRDAGRQCAVVLHYAGLQAGTHIMDLSGHILSPDFIARTQVVVDRTTCVRVKAVAPFQCEDTSLFTLEMDRDYSYCAEGYIVC